MDNSTHLRRILFYLLVLVCFSSAHAGTMGWVHSFAATDPNTGVAPDGFGPVVGVTPGTDGNFYGLAYSGYLNGSLNGKSVVYRVTPSGEFSVVFTSTNDSYAALLDPTTPLVAVKNSADGKMVFYHAGGGGSDSNLMKITTDGTAAGTTATSIYQFAYYPSGQSVRGALLYDGEDANGKTILYGAAAGGGTKGKGTLFKIVTDGSSNGTVVTILHNFGNTDPNAPVDGVPVTTLVKGTDGNLYGTTTDTANTAFGEVQGDNGKVFQCSPDTGAYNVVYTFPLSGPTTPSSLVEASPGIFYGTARSPNGGPGIIYKLTVIGSTGSFATVYTFPNNASVPVEYDPLLLDEDGLMYGVLDAGGGVNKAGQLFSVTPDGTVTDLYDFSSLNNQTQTNADGYDPYCKLAIDADGNLYGTASEGGAYGNGTVYRLNTPPKPPLPAFTSFDAQAPSSDGGPMHFTATITPNVKVVVQFSTDGTNWRAMLDGGIMTEQPAGSGNYVLDSAAYPAGSVSFRALATKPGSTRSVSDSKGPFTLHTKPGVSATGFTVNESSSPQAGLTDSILRFAVNQTGAPTHLLVKVQASTDNNTWTDLADNNSGQMGFDPETARFVLNSSSYPVAGTVYFRARATGAGVDPSTSNAVGPFNLASNLVHVVPPRLYFTGNGHVADFDFRAKYPDAQSGVTVRVQVSNTPADESSWQAFDQAGFATMTQTSDATVYRYLLNKSPYPDGSNIFFRAKADRSDFNATVSGVSNPCGPFSLESGTPPKATLQVSGSSGGTGTADDPLILRGDTLELTTQTFLSAGRTLAALAIELNGEVLPQLSAGHVKIPIPVVGDHVLQARVADDLGLIARATGALFIRVLPGLTNNTAAKSSSSAAGTQAANTNTAWIAVQDGDFNDPSVWQDQAGHSGVPGVFDAVFIGAHTINSRGTMHAVDSLSINGGSLVGNVDNPNSTNVVEGIAPQSKCTILGSVTIVGHFTLQSHGVLELDNVADLKFVAGANGLAGTIQNYKQCNIHGSAGIANIASFENFGTLAFLSPLDAPSLANASAVPTLGLRAVSNVTSGGKLRSAEIATAAIDGSTIVRTQLSGLIGQDGNGLIGQDGNGVVSNDGGTLIGQDGNGLIGQDGNGLIGQDGNGLIGQDGNGIVAQGGGNLVSGTGQSPAASAGAVNRRLDATLVSPAITLNGGEVDLDGITLLGDVVLNGGILSGSGAIYGNLTNNGGFITPGHSAGHIAVAGNFTQTSGGTLVIENGGFLPAQFDALLVGGTAQLGGRLEVKTINGYQPGTGDTFSPLSYTAVTGAFDSVSGNTTLMSGATGLINSVDITKPSPTAGLPSNISTRGNVQTGDNVLIAGIIISGPPGSTKKVLVRALGPTLTQFNVPTVLADPALDLYDGNGAKLTSNDDWAQDANAGGIPANYQPQNAKEAAILTTLAPGNYTAIVHGTHGETGNALAEVYDLDPTSSASLGNISTRGYVQTGDNVMIGGFIVSGTEPAKILVRAIGPSLTAYGVSGVLADPTLEVYDTNGDVLANDDWRNTQENEILATGKAPDDNRESAALLTLAPGNYTAIVRGKNDSTGVALVEAYVIP